MPFNPSKHSSVLLLTSVKCQLYVFLEEYEPSCDTCLFHNCLKRTRCIGISRVELYMLCNSINLALLRLLALLPDFVLWLISLTLVPSLKPDPKILG